MADFVNLALLHTNTSSQISVRQPEGLATGFDPDCQFRDIFRLEFHAYLHNAAHVDLQGRRIVGEEIRFYRASEKPYGAFSNLYRRPIEFEGDVFATSEHAYQAGKARKPEVRRWLMQAPSPALLAMAAHGLYYWDVAPGWSKTKFDRMRRVLAAKFTQHNDLRELLLSTGEARLVESATVDNEVNRLWGEVNGVGQNMLGTLLMELRQELRQPTDRLVAWVGLEAAE
jgi:ribA/ribD-fused uncharacterized protein